jgi:hypothetical protein
VSDRPKIDVDGIKARADIVEVVQRYVPLRKAGKDWVGLCPFHSENSRSFTVSEKGFVHCFGCGAHYDVIGFIQAITGATFVDACRQLGAEEFGEARAIVRRELSQVPDVRWVPILPVPGHALELMADESRTVPVHNPGSGKTCAWRPERVDAYRDARGALLGYVLRLVLPAKDGKKAGKWTPMVTWCVGPDGAQQWCLQAFPEPRPMCGLDALAAMPWAPALVVEGEKCRAAGAGAQDQYAVMTWPGGSNGIAKVDWSPLHGRDVVLWPDADPSGVAAMMGKSNLTGLVSPGVAQLVARAGARSIRIIDTSGQPKGWDIADALQVDLWTWPQLAAWAAARVADVRVVRA